MITVQIDDGPAIYLVQPDAAYAEAANSRAAVITGFISFPRGSRKITLRAETDQQFFVNATGGSIFFAGCRQQFTKLPFEKLTIAQAIIKDVDISPISLYGTIYGHNAGTLYSPAASDDNINTVVETGSFSGSGASSTYNAGTRTTSTSGDFTDHNITLVGGGGGLAIVALLTSSKSHKVAIFISTSAINEGTDRIGNFHLRWGSNYFDQKIIGQLGLPAATYNIRIKNEQASGFDNHGIIIYDTVSPQENANTVTDITSIPPQNHFGIFTAAIIHQLLLPVPHFDLLP